jgi:hypothetical protein
LSAVGAARAAAALLVGVVAALGGGPAWARARMPEPLRDAVIDFSSALRRAPLACQDPPAPTWATRVGDCPPSATGEAQDLFPELSRMRELGSQVALPERLNVDPCGEESRYEPDTRTLRVSPRWTSRDTGRPMDARYAHAVLAHEYAHAVFEAAMGKDPALGAWSRYHREWSEAEGQLLEVQSRLRSAPGLPRTQEQPREIDWELARKRVPELDLVLRRVERAKSMLNVIDAYDELFADLFAAVHARDPRIMREALYSEQGGEWYRRLTDWRDFSRAMTADDRAFWAPYAAEWRARGADGEKYLLLAPARNAIWKQISADVASPAADRGKILQGLFSALARDFRQNFPDYGALERFDPVGMNERLAKESFRAGP